MTIRADAPEFVAVVLVSPKSTASPDVQFQQFQSYLTVLGDGYPPPNTPTCWR